VKTGNYSLLPDVSVAIDQVYISLKPWKSMHCDVYEPSKPRPSPKRLVGFCILANGEGLSMWVVETHQYGGTWVLYVIAPTILFGVIACLRWIVKGAIGVFGQKARQGHRVLHPEDVEA
jgi:hypothetical protein